jgi:hypothetical protein
MPEAYAGWLPHQAMRSPTLARSCAHAHTQCQGTGCTVQRPTQNNVFSLAGFVTVKSSGSTSTAATGGSHRGSMVYQEANQLKRYHKRPEQFLSTYAHFLDGPGRQEAPAPEFRHTAHKQSTFANLYQGSAYVSPGSRCPHQQQRIHAQQVAGALSGAAVSAHNSCLAMPRSNRSSAWPALASLLQANAPR